tara:strand:+ start:4246 stop:5112 length:867 start_codon:yes stop_codon:yes gene_type:complete
MKKTLAIDGNNLIHRTYHTAKMVSEGNEELQDGLHIKFTLSAIKSYVEMFKPSQTYITWDQRKGDHNWRKKQYSDYKGNRSGDSAPHSNTAVITEMLKHLGINSVYPLVLEADDIISYMTQEIDGKTVIISADQDFIQLINPLVILYDPVRKRYFNEENMEERTGYVTVEEWLQAKYIRGDKSDNVPGVKGYGTAKISKVLAGHIELSDEQMIICDRNADLFDLNKYKVIAGERDWYIEQFDMSTEPSYDMFVELCKTHKQGAIIQRKSDWYSTFFSTNSVVDLLNRL